MDSHTSRKAHGTLAQHVGQSVGCHTNTPRCDTVDARLGCTAGLSSSTGRGQVVFGVVPGGGRWSGLGCLDGRG